MAEWEHISEKPGEGCCLEDRKALGTSTVLKNIADVALSVVWWRGLLNRDTSGSTDALSLPVSCCHSFSVEELRFEY